MECTAYPKLASLPTSFSRNALLVTDTLKSHIHLGYGNISHTPLGSTFALMTLASNTLVRTISNISLLPSEQIPTTLLKIGKATSSVASPLIGIMHSSMWILTCPSMSGSNLSNTTHTQHRQSHSTAPMLRTLSHTGRTIRHQHRRTTATYLMRRQETHQKIYRKFPILCTCHRPNYSHGSFGNCLPAKQPHRRNQHTGTPIS